MRTLCVILGRAGSKGLAHKNIAPLAGRPLIAWTIDHARAARSVDAIVVSTDGPAIADAARAMDVTVIDRPAELASDTATVDAAARHAVETVERETVDLVDAVVILYANVPLRPAGLIDQAVATLAETGCDSVQSVCPVGKMHPYWMKTLGGPAGDRLEAYQANAVYRRQDLPPVYQLDGGIIAVRRAAVFTVRDGEPHAFLGEDRRAVVTEPGAVVDIDEAKDLALATALVGRADDPGAASPANEGEPARLPILGWREPVFVIAELGVNHDGEVERALELVDAAAEVGADAVKLQLFDADRLLSADAELAAYQEAAATDPHELLNRLQLDEHAMRQVGDRAHELGLGFIVTCFSVELVETLRRLEPDAIKLASPDFVNLPLIEAVVALDKPLLLSTGAVSADEAAATLSRLADRPHVALLACVSGYPTADADAALRRIGFWGGFGRPVGYSDHTTATETGALAAAAGACVLEKHLTYDRAAAGPDHAASLDPTGFADYVAAVRRATAMLGTSPAPMPSDCERDVRRVSRQSVCAARDLPAGHRLEAADLTVKRPGTGIPAAKLSEVIGRVTTKTIEANRLLHADDVSP